MDQQHLAKTGNHSRLRAICGAVTSLDYWFPKIEAAGIPVPKTILIPTDVDLHHFMDAQRPPRLDELIAPIREAILKVGCPAFLRTGYTSGKHDFRRSCFVESADPDAIARHIYGIYEYSEMTQITGLPLDLWVVREYLNVHALFTAFNGLPIAREFRIFCEKGMPTQYQPYWPEGAISDHSNYGGSLPDDWRDRLRDLNTISVGELWMLHNMSQSAASIDGLVEHDWSIDWLWTVDRGWVLIDMAEKRHSYHSPDIADFSDRLDFQAD